MKKKTKAERNTLMSMMIHPNDLEIIDQVAENIGVSRSEFFRTAAREKVIALAKKGNGDED